jgi:hypothetical protein
MRGMDQAGNIGNAVPISLTLNNAPPSVSITKRWWIWESGQLKVSPNHFPIASIQVTIRDPQNRWSAVTMDFDTEKASSLVKWDRRFADGIMAPSGEYPVLAVACDLNGLCGRDTGVIVVPGMVALTATQTPSPTATSVLPSMTAVITQTPTIQVLITPLPEKIPEHTQPSIPFWQILGLLGMFMAIASAGMVDPRPMALDRLSETFRGMPYPAKDDSFETNKFRNVEKDI